MKRTLVRYKTKPDGTAENQRLVEDVFRELRTKSPKGLRYMVLKLADGSFIHFAETEDGAARLPEFDAFRRFQSNIGERCIEAPQANDTIIIGNYRMLAGMTEPDDQS